MQVAAWADMPTPIATSPPPSALPVASFVVSGARPAADAAFVIAAAEMKWLSGWSAAATFESELSNLTSSHAGKGVVQYAW
jgi:hypothetical protein